MKLQGDSNQQDRLEGLIATPRGPTLFLQGAKSLMNIQCRDLD
jgi:hypothetical protein